MERGESRIFFLLNREYLKFSTSTHTVNSKTIESFQKRKRKLDKHLMSDHQIDYLMPL